jgi:hypothetical protein
MLTQMDLNELARLDVDATAGPWVQDRFDDEHFMTAIGVRADLPDLNGRLMSEFIVATQIQQSSCINPSDGKEIENASLIAAMRNALPELLRLAAIGLATTIPASNSASNSV